MSVPALSNTPAIQFGANIRLTPDPSINTTIARESLVRKTVTERLGQHQARVAADYDATQPLSISDVLPEHEGLLLNRSVFGEDKLVYLTLKSLKSEVDSDELTPSSPLHALGLSVQEKAGISQKLGRAMERHLKKTTLDVYI